MKFGYMSGFRGDLLSEIKFAREHFDFTEITIQPELLLAINDILPDLKKAADGFMVLGHIHWKILNPEDIKKNILILKDLGAKKITIHPFEKLNIEENAKALNPITSFTHDNGLALLIENISSAPYNSATAIKELLDKIPLGRLTLDVGHANRILELDNFFRAFPGQIEHVHLHDNTGEADHQFYEDQERLSKALLKLKSIGYDGTVLLETFSVARNGLNVSQELPEIQNMHIEQLKKIKNENWS